MLCEIILKREKLFRENSLAANECARSQRHVTQHFFNILITEENFKDFLRIFLSLLLLLSGFYNFIKFEKKSKYP